MGKAGRMDDVIAFHRDTIWIVAVLVVSAGLLAAFARAATSALGISWRIWAVTGFRRWDDVFLVIVTLILLMLCAGLIGLMLLALRAWRMRDVPLITLGPDGVTDRRRPARTIAWSDIADARIEWGGRSAPTRLWLTLDGDQTVSETPIVLGALRENPADLLTALKAYPAYRGR